MQVGSKEVIVASVVLLSQVGWTQSANAERLDGPERVERIQRIQRIALTTGVRSTYPAYGQEVGEIVIDRSGMVTQVQDLKTSNEVERRPSRMTWKQLDEFSDRLNQLSQQVSRITDSLSEDSERVQSRDASIAAVRSQVQDLATRVELGLEAIEANSAEQLSKTSAAESLPNRSTPIAIGPPISAADASEVKRLVVLQSEELRTTVEEPHPGNLHPLRERLERLKRKLKRLQLE